MKLKKFPKIPKGVKIAYNVLERLVRIVFLLLLCYAVIFTVGVTWGAWQGYKKINAFLDEVKVLRTENPVQTNYMQVMQDTMEGELKHIYVPLDSINPWLVKAVLAAEDAGFYYHPGVDVRAIAEAMDMNKKRKRTVFGGSTITQQVAKNLFLSSERSWERKGKELAYALLMEHYLGKERILELYLNYAQWGKKLFGAEAACQEYYKRSCQKISVEQSVNLAAILANPSRYNPYMRKSKFMTQRRGVIYANMFPRDTLNLDSTNTLIVEENPE